MTRCFSDGQVAASPLANLCCRFFPRSSAGADSEPVPVVFDTDMGNEIDDVFAIGLLDALQSRGACEITAVTVSKDHALAAPFCDVINIFYGRGDIPIRV